MGGPSLAALALAGLTLAVAGAEPSPLPEASAIAAVAERIDQLIEIRCSKEKVSLARPSSDAEFLRRLSLDLTGRIPAAGDVHRFLADTNRDKRRQMVESLLASPRFSEHQTNLWRGLFLPEDNNRQVLVYREQLEAWLRPRLHANVPWDRLVRELLTTPLTSETAPTGEPQAEDGAGSPTAFYRANQARPENLAAVTARLFLGVRLECAQCHNHPFDRWTQTQFWEFAAFFAGLEVQHDTGSRILSIREGLRRTLPIPETTKEVSARFLDGTEPNWRQTATGRTALAAWVTASANPFFARNAVNRLWSQLFGLGLVEPADDFGENNPLSHPELLDELARQLVANNHDLRFILRAILASRTYQRGSAPRAGGSGNLRLFARMPVRGLSPEQLFDSIVQATGYPERAERPARRAEFLTQFAGGNTNRTEQQTSILQVLVLMNGTLLGNATTLSRGRVLTGIAEAPWLDTAGRIQALYLAALSRPPTAEESRQLTAFVESGERKQALTDVFWALLNSSEFLFNH